MLRWVSTRRPRQVFCQFRDEGMKNEFSFLFLYEGGGGQGISNKYCSSRQRVIDADICEGTDV